MNPLDPSQFNFRQQNPPREAIDRPRHAEDLLESLLQDLEGGDLHLRPVLDVETGNPFPAYFEIGIALRRCLETPSRRDYLITRLRPHRDYIIGVLPAGMQQHGLLPAPQTLDSPATPMRELEAIGDDEIRRWIIADGSLVYGELQRYEIENYFDTIRPLLAENAVMYDLGSGLGKVVMSAAVSLPIARCTGVEILAYRHRMATERRAGLLTKTRQGLAALPQPLRAEALLPLPNAGSASGRHLIDIEQRIAFIEGDMFAVDVSDADLVFLYSTCFGSLMPQIAEKLAKELRPHALVSTFTYQLSHPAFIEVGHFPGGSMAWTDCYLYEHIPPRDELSPAAIAWEEKVRQEFTAIDARLAADAAAAAPPTD